jgi:hypothetical protein
MKKRVLAAFLWFYAGWYAGAILAEFLGVSPVLGPVLGAAVAAVVVGDPRRIIWSRRAGAMAAVASPAPEVASTVDVAPDPA